MNTVTEIIISGNVCDKVLQFKKPLIDLYRESAILTRVRLSEVAVDGYFMLDTQGQIFNFCEALDRRVL